MQIFAEISCKIGFTPVNLLRQCLLVPAPWPIKTIIEYNHHLCMGLREHSFFFIHSRKVHGQVRWLFCLDYSWSDFEDLDICSTPVILIHFCRRCSTSAFLRGYSMEKLWNSFVFVSLSFCLLPIPNLQYLGQSSDAWMKCRRSLQNKISVLGPGLLSHCLLLVGRLWICPGLSEIKTPHGDSLLYSLCDKSYYFWLA